MPKSPNPSQPACHTRARKQTSPKFLLSTLALVALALCAAVSAQTTVTTIANFDLTNGWEPSGNLVQGFDGNFYGVTEMGGTLDNGTAFKITPDGTLTTIHNFCTSTCGDGKFPFTGLILAPNGNFYGSTVGGGAHDGGVVFVMTPQGEVATLYSFCAQTACADGSDPRELLLASNGNLYGTTAEGGNGANCRYQGGCGTVFELTLTREFTSLYDFCTSKDCADGSYPYGSLVQGVNGNFYGTTSQGGITGCQANSKGCGTIFEITPAGKLTTLYRFCSQTMCTDGAEPQAGLTLASNGNYYGTTLEGGNYFGSTGYYGGTAFEITPQGKFSTLYTFCPDNTCTNGSDPFAGITQGTDGNLYTVTSQPGMVTAITPQGEATVYIIFDWTTNGVIQATNGSFYGVATAGGTNGDGFVYTLSAGLAPFAETLPTSGKTGARVVILGNDLTGTTSVTFNGTPASYKVESPNEIITAVPSGATSGTVEVVTSGGMLKSNVVFRVVE